MRPFQWLIRRTPNNPNHSKMAKRSSNATNRLFLNRYVRSSFGGTLPAGSLDRYRHLSRSKSGLAGLRRDCRFQRAAATGARRSAARLQDRALSRVTFFAECDPNKHRNADSRCNEQKFDKADGPRKCCHLASDSWSRPQPNRYQSSSCTVVAQLRALFVA